MKKKKLLFLFAFIVLLAVGYAYSIISSGFGIAKTTYVYIDERKDYNDLIEQLNTKAKIKSHSDFNILASLLGLKDNLRVGRYAVSPDMSVLGLIRNIRNGRQEPVDLKFNNIRTKTDLAKRISDQLMFSEENFLAILDDPAQCAKYGFAPSTIVAMFIPNTYEFYWNVSLEDFMGRMDAEYKRFWNEDRIAKAKAAGLTPVEVSILASIVEEECTYSDEYPMVAGLYLNRLRIGQNLQADPTVKFAVGDFSLRRILNVHLQVDSPYNTYKYAGLPPGPIRVPSIKGIDAVLNYSHHDYLYMCAKEDFSGRHNFAVTYADHQRNAALYRKALDARGII